MQGVAVDGRGAVYACDVGLAAVVRLDADGRIERWCESAGGTPLIAPNWGAFAPDGSMWFSDSGTERVGACDGRLIRVPPGGGDGEPVDVGPLDFPNGLAVGEDGTVFLLESFTPRLSALRRAGLETLAELPGVVPDGVALTADGEFVVSCYYPFRILLVSRSGRDVAVLIDDEQGIHIPMPTNVAFFGDGLRSLAIACLGGSTICALDATGFAGAPLIGRSRTAERDGGRGEALERLWVQRDAQSGPRGRGEHAVAERQLLVDQLPPQLGDAQLRRQELEERHVRGHHRQVGGDRDRDPGLPRVRHHPPSPVGGHRADAASLGESSDPSHIGLHHGHLPRSISSANSWRLESHSPDAIAIGERRASSA